MQNLVITRRLKGVKNLNVDVAEKDGNIIFLHKIVEGSASRSYGIHVAKLAGVPRSVLDAAEHKLAALEQEYNDIKLIPVPDSDKEPEQQLSMFNVNDSVIVQKLKSLDIMNITPSQAFKVLEELKEEAENS